MPNEKTSEKFYDSIADEYTDAVRRCVPRYDEMLSALFAYLPEDFSPGDVLELGCGTGNLTIRINERFPNAKVMAVDLSGESLKVCRSRLCNPNVRLVRADLRELDFQRESFNLVVSSIAIHHLRDDEKEELFGKLYHWLTDDGIFTFSDQFRGEAEHIYRAHILRWEDALKENGFDESEWNTWMEHQKEHDHHATLSYHYGWLRKAGFKVVDCTWRYLLWATLYAQKAEPTAPA